MQRKFHIALFIALIFLTGIFLSFLGGASLYFDAKESWKNKAILQGEEISRVFAYWLDLEVKTLNNIAAVYYSFPEINKTQLQSITQYYQYSSLLDTSINVGLINENEEEQFYVVYSSTESELLNSSMLLSENDNIVNMVNQLLIGNEEIVVSSVFMHNKQVYCYIATLAPSNDFGGILVSLLPLGEILDSLTNLYLEEGLKLEISNSEENSPIVLSKNIQGEHNFSYEQRLYHSGVDWKLDWSVYDNYQGGIPKGLVLSLLIFGGVISFLISFIFGVLYRRHEKVNLLVTKRTTELELANKHLNAAKTELVNAEKMASLGRLVAGMSHELNTPIGISLTGASSIYDKTLAFKEKSTGEGITKSSFNQYIALMEESSSLVTLNLERASKLISNLKHVSTDQESSRFRSFNLKETLIEIVNTLNHLLKKNNVSLDLNIPEDIEMRSYPGALGQVFTNLITNSITHGFHHKSSGKILIKLFSINKNIITLQYRDNGCGIAKEYIDKVFEPFFTTKLSQGGSGIGLNIVYTKITQKLQGEVKLSSEVNRGVNFDIKIPVNLEKEVSIKDMYEVKNSH